MKIKLIKRRTAFKTKNKTKQIQITVRLGNTHLMPANTCTLGMCSTRSSSVSEAFAARPKTCKSCVSFLLLLHTASRRPSSHTWTGKIRQRRSRSCNVTENWGNRSKVESPSTSHTTLTWERQVSGRVRHTHMGFIFYSLRHTHA